MNVQRKNLSMEILQNYIKIFDLPLGDTVCKDLIKQFEECKDQQEEIKLEGHRSFNQITLHNHDNWKKYEDWLNYVFKESVRFYIEKSGVTEKQFPQQYAFEAFRMKRYMPNDIDEFNDHVDVGNHESAKRFLAFFFYLNDTDDESGCTEFPHFNLRVVPKTNRMLVFPPMWTYLHAGRKVTGKTPKYTMGSYLHYF